MRIQNCLGFVALCFLLPTYSPASTKVGNGGDMVEGYLTTTRHALNETLAQLKTDQSSDTICVSQSHLNTDQKHYCGRFILDSLEGLTKLNSGPDASPLRLTRDPLWAEDPWGGRRPVSAGTECGPFGEILFHYDSVKTLIPRDLFALLMHELSHKVGWEGATCVQDTVPVGPFTSLDGGRQLLDAVGMALSHYALRKGIIGQSFGIVDVFLCTIRNDDTGLSFPSYAQIERLITDPDNLTSYVTGVGHHPRAPECAIVEDFGRKKTSLRLSITEQANCSGPDTHHNRHSQAWVVREIKTNEGTETTTLQHDAWPGYNPLCRQQTAASPFTVAVQTENGQRLVMEIEYLYSQALRDSRMREPKTTVLRK